MTELQLFDNLVFASEREKIRAGFFRTRQYSLFLLEPPARRGRFLYFQPVDSSPTFFAQTVNFLLHMADIIRNAIKEDGIVALVLTRKPGQSIIVDDKVRITVVEIDGMLKLNVEAPRSIKVMREELLSNEQRKLCEGNGISFTNQNMEVEKNEN